VWQFVSDIFDGDRESIDYVLKMLATMCGGHTSDALFHVMIGTGANGKSKLQELMCLTLGAYYCTVPCTLFTGRRGAAQGATAAFEHLANKRAVFVQEPERGQQMNGGLLKELSGGGYHLFPVPLQVGPRVQATGEVRPGFQHPAGRSGRRQGSMATAQGNSLWHHLQGKAQGKQGEKAG
jgi:hypothetical protein